MSTKKPQIVLNKFHALLLAGDMGRILEGPYDTVGVSIVDGVLELYQVDLRREEEYRLSCCVPSTENMRKAMEK